MWRRFYVLMAEADAGEGGNSGGSNASAVGNGSDAGTSGADTGAATGGSVLSSAGEGAAQSPAIPEKYQVKKEDGSLDIEASSLKLAEAYGHLEKRMGSGDVPPKTADEYQIAVPDAFKDAIDPKSDPLLGAFMKDAHAAGLTQKQMDMVMGKYFEIAPGLVNGSQQISEQECIADLKATWKDDATFKAEVGKSYKALVTYAGDDAEALMQEHGNDPRFIRMLNRVGAELGEDKPINPGGTPQGSGGIESLMQSEAYTNPKHADHARVSAQVQSYFNKQAESAARSGNVPLL